MTTVEDVLMAIASVLLHTGVKPTCFYYSSCLVLNSTQLILLGCVLLVRWHKGYTHLDVCTVKCSVS